MAVTEMVLPPTTKLEPRGDSVVIELMESTGFYKEGVDLVIPDNAQRETYLGKVLAVGPGKIIDIDGSGQTVRKPMDTKVGDYIIFARFHGEKLDVNGTIYVLLKEDDILSGASFPEESLGHFFHPVKAGSNSQVDRSIDQSRVIE